MTVHVIFSWVWRYGSIHPLSWVWPVLELYQMKWGVRLHLPRNLYGWGAWMWGVRWCSYGEVGDQLKKLGVVPLGTPSNLNIEYDIELFWCQMGNDKACLAANCWFSLFGWNRYAVSVLGNVIQFWNRTEVSWICGMESRFLRMGVTWAIDLIWYDHTILWYNFSGSDWLAKRPMKFWHERPILWSVWTKKVWTTNHFFNIQHNII